MFYGKWRKKPKILNELNSSRHSELYMKADTGKYAINTLVVFVYISSSDNDYIFAHKPN